MEAKDKAIELVNKFKLEPIKPFCIMHTEHAKQCALITVDEILNLNFNIKCDASEKCVNPVMNYWEDVKQEIEKL